MKVFLNSSPSKVTTFSPSEVEGVFSFHRTLPNYTPTPLVPLNRIADRLGVEHLLIKDEGKRFGLKAFKALGASHAVFRILHERSGGNLKPEDFLTEKGRKLADGTTFSCATDGNHGRAVAWIARLLGRPSVIFVPHETVPARIEAIESEGAKVIVVNGGYDDAVRRAAEEAKKETRLIIADTGYAGYMKIPLYIQQGYLTLFKEISIQLKEQGEKPPDIVFIQSGVGAFAFAAASYFHDPATLPRLISVEPTAADCLFRSAETGNGRPHSIIPEENTIMAGLNCGTPSLTAWPAVRDRFDAFVAVEDNYAKEAMMLLADEGVVSGESGAAGLAGLIALHSERPDFIEKDLRIRHGVRVLLINTEANTNPEGYYKIVGKTATEVERITPDNHSISSEK
ncbi:MAG: diaminopropionate ammonia-lyase [Syntrophales bacterium]|nr:diaminopropionate ammonia-lyase [Syntrophales bacterium]